MDYSAIISLPDEPLNIELNRIIERAAEAKVELPRAYLGESIIDDECSRKIQFEWWIKPLLPARVKSIFARGHFFEARIREHLLNAGFVFAPSKTLEFVALDGYLQGHADGVLISGPALPGIVFPALWEHKALNAKNFRAVGRDGLTKVFPKYAVQVAIYQHFLGKLNPALVTVANADTCELLHLAVPYNAERAQRGIERAVEIIAATKAGELLPRAFRDPSDWRCKMCPFLAKCWGPS
jgi:hypothetical protein